MQASSCWRQIMQSRAAEQREAEKGARYCDECHCRECDGAGGDVIEKL